MGKLITRIRQKLCFHRYADCLLDAKHDEENYIFTNVCLKCGKMYTAVVPRKCIETWEREAKKSRE